MTRRLVALAALLACPAFAAEKPAIEGAEPGRWTMDYDAAKRVAAERQLPLLLNFTGSDWCGWCKLMDKAVFSKPAWEKYAKANLMLVWIDFPNDKALVPEKYVARNDALKASFGIQGYPTYVLLDADGKTPLGSLGASAEMTSDLFIDEINERLQDRAVVIEKQLKTLKAETSREYLETTKALTDAEASLEKLRDDFKSRSDVLSARIEEHKAKLDAIRLDARLAKLPPQDAVAYRTKHARFAEVETALSTWLQTNPERNAENTKKFNAWNEELAKLKQEMRALVSPAK